MSDERKLSSSSLLNAASLLNMNLYLRERSIRVIFRIPHARHTDTAFADQAVVKFMRGPASNIEAGLSLSEF